MCDCNPENQERSRRLLTCSDRYCVVFAAGDDVTVFLIYCDVVHVIGVIFQSPGGFIFNVDDADGAIYR